MSNNSPEPDSRYIRYSRYIMNSRAFCNPWQLFIVWSSVSSPENPFAPNKANVHIVQILAIECYYRRVVIVQWPLKRYSIVQAEKWTIALWSSCSVALTSSVAVLVALWSSCSVAVSQCCSVVQWCAVLQQNLEALNSITAAAAVELLRRTMS